ncbi:MAG TPA: hypothetical protein VID74_00665 [Gemmatimonadales bacterium]|jgi:hypothetical protein
MDDKQLDRLLDDAARRWRMPVDPPLDAIWSAVASEAFQGRSRSSPGWGAVGIAAAVALIVGVLGGRFSARQAPLPVTTTAARLAPLPVSPASAAGPNQRAMSELLGRTAVLLEALPADNAAADVDPGVTVEGARLLTITRLLLDSPAGSDVRLHNLLQDLELVLAQVARLEPGHHRDEMQFIQTALDEHDIVPRVRSAAADLSLQDF